MDIDLAECICTGIDKLVRGEGRGNHDLAGSGVNRFVADGEGGLCCLDDKDFFVGMAVEFGPLAGLCFDQNNRDVRIAIFPTPR